MSLMHARSVTIEWDDGSTDTWEDSTVESHATGEGGTNPLSPEATAIKYKVVVLMESKVVAHSPAQENR